MQVIANPNAAGGRAARVIPVLEERLRREGIEHFLHRTTAPGHARELAAAARTFSESPILVVGGDGTVHEVATGLLSGRTAREDGSSLPALAVLPVGTGNDFHRMVRAPGDVSGAVRTLKEGRPRPFDVGLARWDGGSAHFVNLLGVGIDVEVLRRRASYRALSGLPQYLAALASALVSYRPVEVRVAFSGPEGSSGSVEGPVLLSAVTVGPSVGGGFLLSPGARRDDGLLDLFVAERLGLLRVLRYLPGVLRGTLDAGPGIHRRQVTRVQIGLLGNGTLAFELDGELMPYETRSLDIQIHAGALRILELPDGEGD